MRKFLINTLFSVIAATWRIKIKGELTDKAGIIVFWHGKMLPVWYAFRKFQPIAVVSKSKDGQVLSDLLKSWHFDLIRGSSSSDGKRVLSEIIQQANNRFILMTPDGPRGKRHVFKAGAAVAAARANSNLYYIFVNSFKCKKFEKSWDKFEFPLPWAKIELTITCAGHPLSDSHSEIDAFIAKIENEMNAVC